uniref:Histidine kinase n=1 Tax=Magnetococcus massalia (strain MO-1) TaxID=451514 RepID=A0A1S7LP22_MAGMO|nr:Exported protein of unknown function [Candidatus Magnetococcus massalia]
MGIRRWTQYLLILLTLLLPFSSGAEEKILTADIRHRPPEMIVDGPYQGGPLKVILEEAASKMGYTIRWRHAPFSTSLSDLKSGQVDLVPRVIRKQDREPFVHFLGPIGSQRKDIVFLVRTGHESLVRSYDDLKNLTIGVKEKTAYFAPFNKDDALNKITSTGGDYGLAGLFIEGKVDTVAVLDQAAMDSALAGLGFSDYTYANFRHVQTIENYYGFSRNSPNAALQKRLNTILKQMRASGRVAALYNKHQATPQPVSNSELVLTVEEKKWLLDHPEPLRVHNELDYPPLNYAVDGKPRGFSIDYMDLLARKLGLSINYITGPSWDQFIQQMRSGELDVMLNIVRTPDREKFLAFTEPYVDNPPVFVSRRDQNPIRNFAQLKGKRISIPKGFFYEELIKRHYPEVKIHSTKNLLESLQAVAGGEADAATGGLAIENWLIQKYGLTNLRVDSVIHDPNFSNSMHIAVAKENPILRNLLQKASDQVTQAEFNTLQKRWFGGSLISSRVKLTQEERTWISHLEKPLRVGSEMDWPPFDFVHNDRATGFSNELIRRLAQEVDLPVAFIHGFSWSQLMEKFKSGELDILPAVYQTPERLKSMLFAGHYVSNPTVLVTSDRVSGRSNLSEYNGKKVAVVEGFATAKLMALRYPKIILVPVKNVLEGLKAVSLGKTDALIGSHAVINHLLKKHVIPDIHIRDEVWLKQPEETQLFIGVKKEHAILHRILSKTLAAQPREELDQLRREWLPIAGGQKGDQQVALTQQEKSWLQAHSSVRLADDYAWPPFSFLNEEGQFSGIAAGFSDALAKRSGITFKPQYDLTWPQVIEGLKQQTIDIVPAIVPTQERRKLFNFTKPYISFPVVITTRKDGGFIDKLKDLNGQRVGVVEGYVTESYLRKDHPTIKRVLQKNVESGLKALEEGEIDAFVGNLGVITYTMNRLEMENIKIAAPTKYSFEIAFGVRKDWPELATILDKHLQTLSERERTAIKNTWIAIQVQFGTNLRQILIWVIPLGAVLLLILGLTVFWNRRLGREVEQRARTQEALSRQGAQLDLALDSMSDGLMMLDANFCFVLRNARFLELMGLSEELTQPGCSVEQAMRYLIQRGDLGDIDGDAFIAGKIASFSSQTPSTQELITPNGTHLELRETPTSDGGVVVIVADVTQRKRSEAEIREREQRLQLVLKGGELGIWDVDLVKEKMVVNERWAEILGFSHEEILPTTQQTWKETIHPEDIERVYKAGHDYRSNQVESYEVEYRAVAKDGTIRWLLSKGEAVERDENGLPTRMTGTVLDITPWHNSAAALAESEERSRLILSSISEGIFGLDIDGKTTFVNRAAARMLGYQEEELIGLSMHSAVHHTYPNGEHFPRESCRMFLAYTKGEHFQVDDEVLWRKDGSSFPVDYTAIPMRKNGQVVGAVIAFRDITQRQEAELTLRKKLDELEKFSKVAVGRELRMIALKQEINALEESHGQPPRYEIPQEGEQ